VPDLRAATPRRNPNGLFGFRGPYSARTCVIQGWRVSDPPVGFRTPRGRESDTRIRHLVSHLPVKKMPLGSCNVTGKCDTSPCSFLSSEAAKTGAPWSPESYRRKAGRVTGARGDCSRRTAPVLPQIMPRSLRKRLSCSYPTPIRFVAMDAGTWVALAAALLATVVAVVVPWATFRFAMRQDQVRWVREQRSELYVDILVEAYAEQEWLKLETARESLQERARKSFTDKRLPPVERARLGARDRSSAVGLSTGCSTRSAARRLRC
jgi:hypothetical protein